MTAPDEESGYIEIESGVSLFTGEGFCRVSMDGTPVGQLSPAEVREMALHWLAAADAAESDAAVLAELRDIGIEEQQRLGFLYALRKRRQPDE